jgi:hypothetical protein
VFSQVCKAPAILKNAFHLRQSLEGVFGFLGGLPFLILLVELDFDFLGTAFKSHNTSS